VIKFRGETLFAPRISRLRIRAANIAANDPARFVELFERPLKIGRRESAALPICHRLFDAKAIKIDCDVQIFVSEALRKLLKTIAPIFAEDGAFSLLIFRRPVVCPRMHVENPRAFSATIAENLVWPPAFEIAAAPNCHMLDAREFQGAIDPATAAPFRRAHIPVRMIVERNQHDRFSHAAQSKRGQIMEVSRPVKQEGHREIRLVLPIKLGNQAWWRGEAQTRPPFTGVNHGKSQPFIPPRVI